MKKMTTMKSAIEEILTAHRQLTAFRENEHYAVKIVSEGFMPLSIEKHDKLVTVTHYYEQNGDLVPDPDMEFVDLGRGEWLPVAIQHSTDTTAARASSRMRSGSLTRVRCAISRVSRGYGLAIFSRKDLRRANSFGQNQPSLCFSYWSPTPPVNLLPGGVEFGC